MSRHGLEAGIYFVSDLLFFFPLPCLFYFFYTRVRISGEAIGH